MSEALKEDFKKAAARNLKKHPPMPLLSVKDKVEDPAYLGLRAPLRRQWDFMPLETKRILAQEIQRVKNLKTAGEELTKALDYVSLILSLSWKRTPARKVNLTTAQRKLNQTHAGMDKVKEKSIELIAAMNSSGKSGGVICLDGPPGIGKTSIAQSMADAMGRPCEKISMAGVSEQSLIRGFNRTYVGAQHGAILQAMKNAGVSNPVIILDEGDKAGGDSQTGNPTYALLELLDPSQNKGFKDHFMALPYDMSDVLFIITTNNVYDLPPALVDRMEIIALDAYTSEEKISIAQKHLIPRQMRETGLRADQIHFEPAAIALLIEEYTQESGVRKLDQHIKSICRKTNAAIQRKLTAKGTITAAAVKLLLGPSPVYKMLMPGDDVVGCTTGLYFSDVGGGILPIQVKSRVEEKFHLSITGLPGQMIKESVQNAFEMIRHNAARYGIDPAQLGKTHLHMHLPDGATPKDGPSAGIAAATAMISSLTGVSARHDVAMTGEVDLQGNVLPIGGVKQKLQGALKAGARIVLIPAQNERDLFEVPDNIKKALRIIPVRHMDEVLQQALPRLPFKPLLHFSAAAHQPVASNQNDSLNTPCAPDGEKAGRLSSARPDMLAQDARRRAQNNGPV